MHNAKRACAVPRLSAAASLLVAACLLVMGLASASTQTLAHPGWVGNGLNTDPWWQHAVFYRIDSGMGNGAQPDFKAVANTLDALRSLGVDALLVPAPRLPAHSITGSLAAITPNVAPDPALDDFDELIHEASRRGLRVLLELPVPSPNSDIKDSDIAGIARFWLSRGVAGFNIETPPSSSALDTAAMVQTLRKVTSSVVGQRIVLSGFDPDPNASPAASTAHSTTRRRTNRASDTPASAQLPGAQLRIDSRMSGLSTLNAAGIRPLLTQTLAQPGILVGFQTSVVPESLKSDTALAKVMAAVLLTTHSAVLIDAGAGLVLKPNAAQPEEPVQPVASSPAPPRPTPQPDIYVPYVPYVPPPPSQPVTAPSPAPPPPDPLTEWYRELATLHHGNAAFRLGTVTVLNFDQQDALVWVARPAATSTLTPPVVVACNLSSSPVTLAIGAAIKALNLRGNYLQTLLRSDKAMGPQDIDGVVLPPYSVYIGELRR